jgi:NADPH:quinone reductase-like Zn-dependent oxidoreductase
MRAIQIDHYGGPEVIVRRELPVPAPGPGEVLIRLAYSGINFMDIHIRGRANTPARVPIPRRYRRHSASRAGRAPLSAYHRALQAAAT